MSKVRSDRKTRKSKIQKGKGRGLDLYTIIMWNSDASGQYLHWLSVNIPGKPIPNQKRIHGGQTLIRYTAQGQGKGQGKAPHHISIYKQPFYINHKDPITRVGFDLNSFVERYQLQMISDSVKVLGSSSSI